MSLSFFTKAAATKTARWATVPALATAALAMAAGPALAAGPNVRVGTTNAVVSHGQVTVSGYYQCSRWSRTAQLHVTVVGLDRHGRAEASRDVRVACAGTARTWRLTLAPNHRGEKFTPGVVRVDTTLGSQHDRDGHATSSRTLVAHWS
jgi:hypothetical protein